MILIVNSFGARELALIDRDLARVKSQATLWRTNHELWDRDLIEGFGGTVHIAPTGQAIQNLVRMGLRRYHAIPSSQRIETQYAIWGEDSGINPHRDERYRWAATLYLNDSWNPAWGGLLMVRPEPIVPLRGVLVINDSQELHAVSRVRVGAEPRVCLQIWAL